MRKNSTRKMEEIAVDPSLIKERLPRKKDIPDIGSISHELQQVLISSKKNEISLGAIRVIGHIVSCLRDRQIKRGAKEYMEQLLRFDENWFEINNPNTFFSVELSFYWKDFLPEGNRHYEPIREGILELMKFIKPVAFEIEKPNGKKRKMKAQVQFINGFVEEENIGFKISIPNYWYRILLNLTIGYNNYIREIFLNVTSVKSIAFYFYLKSLRNIEKEEIFEGKFDKISFPYKKGTIKKLDELYKMFNIKKRMYWSDFEREYLIPIREELYQKTDISFNYKLENDNLYIVTYEGVNRGIGKHINGELDFSKIRTSLKNKAQKYKLTKKEVFFLMEVYLNYTYDIVYKATTRKSEIKDFLKNYQGEDRGMKYIELMRTLCIRFIKNNENITFYNDEEKIKMRTKLRKYFPILDEEDLDKRYGI